MRRQFHSVVRSSRIFFFWMGGSPLWTLSVEETLESTFPAHSAPLQFRQTYAICNSQTLTIVLWSILLTHAPTGERTSLLQFPSLISVRTFSPYLPQASRHTLATATMADWTLHSPTTNQLQRFPDVPNPLWVLTVRLVLFSKLTSSGGVIHSYPFSTSFCLPSGNRALWSHSSNGMASRHPQNPIDLSPIASCAFKVFEHLIHARIVPHIFPQLEECQGGFRWSADVMAYGLMDSLQSQPHFRRFSGHQEGLRLVLGGSYHGAFTRRWSVWPHVTLNTQVPLRHLVSDSCL